MKKLGKKVAAVLLLLYIGTRKDLRYRKRHKVDLTFCTAFCWCKLCLKGTVCLSCWGTVLSSCSYIMTTSLELQHGHPQNHSFTIGKRKILHGCQVVTEWVSNFTGVSRRKVNVALAMWAAALLWCNKMPHKPTWWHLFQISSNTLGRQEAGIPLLYFCCSIFQFNYDNRVTCCEAQNYHFLINTSRSFDLQR